MTLYQVAIISRPVGAADMAEVLLQPTARLARNAEAAKLAALQALQDFDIYDPNELEVLVRPF